MNDPQEILFDTAGQYLVYDAPQGRPSSVGTPQVFADYNGDTGAAEDATTGVAAIESVSLTFNVASGASQADPKLLNLAAVTGLVRDRTFLATAAYGEREWVEIARIDSSGTNAYGRSLLVHDYVNGDSLVSTRMSIALSAVWLALTAKLSDPMCVSPRWRVRWPYVVDSVSYVGVGWFDVLRAAHVTSVTPADVEGQFPGWLDRLPIDDRVGQGVRLMRRADREVLVDLVEAGKTAWAQRGSPLWNELVLYKARILSAEAQFDNGAANERQLARAEERYEQRFNLIRNPNANQQVSESGAAAVPPRNRLWSK